MTFLCQNNFSFNSFHDLNRFKTVCHKNIISYSYQIYESENQNLLIHCFGVVRLGISAIQTGVTMTNFRNIMLASVSAAILGGCGASDIVSPGTGGNVTINNPPAPAPTPAPTPTPTPTVTAATGCPTIADPQSLKDDGILTGPTGSYRICTLPARIQRNINLPKIAGLVYQLAGRVDVGCDRGPDESFATLASKPCSVNTGTTAAPVLATQAPVASVTLTIAPGVIIYGGTGVSWLAVNRGNRINAIGTAAQPIIFTSRDNILGLNTDSSSGQWGGVVLMGRAPITDCAATNAVTGSVNCERQTEGAIEPALYGGATPGDNSGELRYIQIRYSGYVLSSNTELQALTTEGVGSATQLNYIQSFNSSDDAAEFFGGRVQMKYFISVGAEDDNLDTDVGIKGNFQYVIAVQRSGSQATGADSIIEADSDNIVDGDLPRQNVIVSNMTAIDRTGGNGNGASILLRGGTDYTIVNSLLTTSPAKPCLRISRAQTASTTANAAIDEAGSPIFRSVLFQCDATKYVGSSNVTAAQVAAIFGTGSNGNSDAYTPSLANTFINGATETAVTAFDQTTLNGFTFNGTTVTPAGFFTRTDYIGAVSSASDTWYQTWTCNSSTASFGTGNTGLCTSLPIN
jgi:hypothetical protein